MTRAGILALLAVGGSSACVPDAGRPERTGDAYQLLLAAEDARPVEGDALSLLLEATALDDAFLRRTAVRGLGRLERPALAAAIAERLSDEDGGVRAAAAEALAQSVHGGDGSLVLDDLLDRVAEESDPAVRAMLARSLGRLRIDEADRRRVVEALLDLAGEGAEEPEEVLVGVALGFESLVRLSGGDGVSRPAADLLMELMTRGADQAPASVDDDSGHIRALAASALGQSRRLSFELIGAALEDPEPEIRRVVVEYLGAAPPTLREGLLRRALTDTSARVAIAGIRYLASVAATAPRCDDLIAASAPGVEPSVRISALQALARPCPNFSDQRAALVRAASELDAEGTPWQPAARALLSLASVDTDAAASRLPAFSEHPSPFVRAWAARTATAIRHVPTLFALAVDASANVRTEAVQGLFDVEGRGLDDFLLEQLESDDPRLLMTVAGLLEGAPASARVARALLGTFARLSEAERETWRDPRLALLDRLAELGDASLSERLSPFLTDYDPVVARRVAELLEAWTGDRHVPEPLPLPRPPVPTRAELESLAEATLTLHVRSGGAMVVELLAEQAPTNVARLVRLAEAGYYDGLTFHRWAANFVVQGGSPGANEYAGDGPYTRDEVGGLPHWRGTVGLSTRGRDTGDGQIFINLVDNARLNHDYTVMGRLIAGYDVLDGILEGDVIERAVVTRPR